VASATPDKDERNRCGSWSGGRLALRRPDAGRDRPSRRARRARAAPGP